MNRDALATPRAVLLDWDNTLVDTWPVIHDAMNATLTHMGHVPWTIEETRSRVRLALREAFPAMFGDRWEEARAVFYERFRAIHLERLEIRSGAESLLEALGAKGVYVGVVSNKMGEHLRREAAYLGWKRYFHRLVGAADAARDKPAAEAVSLALEGSGVSAGREVWFVGDTGIDMECAHNTNCIPILVREMPPTDWEFKKFPPEIHVVDCAELAALVMRL